MVNAKKVFALASSYLPSTLTLNSSFTVMIYQKSSLKLRNDNSLVQNACLCVIILHYPYRPPVKVSIKKKNKCYDCFKYNEQSKRCFFLNQIRILPVKAQSFLMKPLKHISRKLSSNISVPVTKCLSELLL